MKSTIIGICLLIGVLMHSTNLANATEQYERTWISGSFHISKNNPDLETYVIDLGGVFQIDKVEVYSNSATRGHYSEFWVGVNEDTHRVSARTPVNDPSDFLPLVRVGSQIIFTARRNATKIHRVYAYVKPVESDQDIPFDGVNNYECGYNRYYQLYGHSDLAARAQCILNIVDVLKDSVYQPSAIQSFIEIRIAAVQVTARGGAFNDASGSSRPNYEDLDKILDEKRPMLTEMLAADALYPLVQKLWGHHQALKRSLM